MPERDPRQEPEVLLAGSDRPRPLPPMLRARLEESLLARDWAAGPGQLPASARQRLQGRLAQRQRWRKWGALGALGAAAAAIAAVIAVSVPGRTGEPLAARPSSGGTGPLVARPRSNGPASQAAASRAPRAFGVLAGPPAGAIKASGGATRRKGPAPANAENGVGPRGQPVKWAALSRSASPAVVSVVPREGPVAGGNWVVLKGSGVGNAAFAYFGKTRAPRVERISSGELRALVPAHAAGTVTVSVGSPPTTGHAASATPVAEPARRAGANRAGALATYTFRR